jgi:hypothetical protein
MKLIDVLQAAKGRVSGGSEFQWKCWDDAQFMDLSDIDGEEIAGCVFNRKTHDVYSVEAHVYDDKISYRWVDPDWKQALKDEANARGIDNKNAYDDVPFIKVKHEDEILSLLTHIVHKTYVHSKHDPKLAAAAEMMAEEERFATPTRRHDDFENLNPCIPWPFPTSNQIDELLADGDSCADCDGGHCGCHDEEPAGWINPEPYTGKEDKMEVEQKQYEVVLTVKHVFEIKADSMEDAIIKARQFQEDMKPPREWGEGVAWIDRFVTKQMVGQRLED